MIARNGGTFLTVNTTSSASGSRFTRGDVEDAFSTAASAASVLTALSASTPRPMTRKITRLMPSAGPAVQNMLRMCAPVVSPPPTSRGTRIVVSESGVILSPK